MDELAAALQRPAEQLTKEGAAAKQSPGARLDACASYVARAERRAKAARDDVESAQKALAAARARQDELDAELVAGLA
eukprot:639844-Karenia_brevis.AAC.1